MNDLDSIKRMLRPGREKHQKVSERLLSFLRMSQRDMSVKYASMAEAEEQVAGYVRESDNDRLRKDQKKLTGKNDYVTIEVPYTYAVLMTAHTYITNVFLSRAPVFQVAGRHGEGEQQVQAMEALLDYQLNVGQMLVPLYVWLFDPGKYSFGVIGQYWDEETTTVREFVEETPSFLGVPIPGAKSRKVPKISQIPGYQGNRLYNVRPQDWFPDTRIPLYQFQRGEFVGRYVELGWHEVLSGAKKGRYFNTDILAKSLRDSSWTSASQGITRDEGSTNSTLLPNATGQSYESAGSQQTGIVKGYEVQVRLVPSDWGLGDDSGSHEVWVFNISTNGIIFGVSPLGKYYRDFDYDILQIEPDGYSLFTKSLAERITPMNDVLSWLLNAHMYNVRQTINNQFIVDPSMVNMPDLQDPRAGKIIRLKPNAYGRDVRTMLTQLQTMDVTRSHIGDMQVVSELIQRMSGVTDNVMGVINQGGRKTATEIRGSNTFSVSRLKTIVEMMSAMGFGPLAQKMVQSSQQLYSLDRKLKVVGDNAIMAPEFMQVTPDLIGGFYDFVPVDGSMPVDRYAQVQLWQNLMAQVVNFPQIVQQYDFAKIFAWVAGLAGLKNIHRFKIQVMPNPLMAQQMQSGNVIPINQAEGMPDLSRVPDNRRPEGMGATG